MQRISTLGKRIDEYCNVKNMSYNGLCALVGMTNRGMANYRQGLRSPTVERCIQMAAAMGVDPVWLQGFDVPMDANALTKPIPIAMLKQMGNKAYWHVSLEGGAHNDKWNILPPHVAAAPEDYHYGERWVAFHQQLYPIAMGDLKALAAELDPKDRRVWVRPLNFKSPLKEGWAELDTSICLHVAENGYGAAWAAYTISLRLDVEEPGDPNHDEAG